MKKKLLKSLLALMVCVSMSFAVSACGEKGSNSDNLAGDNSCEGSVSQDSDISLDSDTNSDSDTSSDSDEVPTGNVPVYQGMTVTQELTVAPTVMSARRKSPQRAPGNTDNNGNHKGWYKGDCKDEDEEVDKDNPFPDNAEEDNIENEISSSLVVEGADKDIYYAATKADVYINVHIANPDNYEILSFTLNGVKYSSYMFERGSDMQTLILKYNVGDVSGVQEYTIDAIKYIDGEQIKDVLLYGEKTVRVGVRCDDQVKATLSDEIIGINDYSFNVNIADKDGLIALSEGQLKAVLYDGETLVATKDLMLGDNAVSFTGLKTNGVYQYAIVGFYDDFSGVGFGMNVLHKNVFNTKAIVLFDEIEIGKGNISFTFAWLESFTNKKLNALKLYLGDNLVQELSVTDTAISGLQSSTEYRLVAEYVNGEQTESIALVFATASKSVPTIAFTEIHLTGAALTFEVEIVDEDGVGAISKIELVADSGAKVEAESVDVRRLTDISMLKTSDCTLRVVYSYDLNDGNGVQEVVCEQRFLAGSIGLAYTPVADGWSVAGIGGCTDKDIVIPREYEGVPVVGIDMLAFAGKEITSVEIPDSVTTIGLGAFSTCVSLTEVVFPKNLRSIGDYAFSSCDGLTSIVLPDGLASIGSSSFEGCYNLAEVVFPDHLQGIGARAFVYCSALTEIVLPDGLMNIGEKAFFGCNNLACVVLGNSVTNIGKSAFESCRSLKEITIPASVKNIGDDSFKNCNVECVNIQDLTAWCHIVFEDIDANPLYQANALYLDGELVTKLTLSDWATGIGDYAFYGYHGLQEIVIPDGVTSIGKSAFELCRGISSITLGSGVESIGDSAFLSCLKLIEVVNNSEYITVTKGADDNGSVGKYALVVFNSGDAYENKFYNQNDYVLYNDGEEKILVDYKGTETQLVLPSGITHIHQAAFYHKNLTSVVIPDSVQVIGNSAFSSCENLTSVVIGNGVKTIGGAAFSGCKKLTDLTIGNGVEIISDYAFYQCAGVTELTIPDSVINIGYCAFDGWTNLTKVTCPTTALGSLIRRNLEVVVLTSGDVIGARIFANCEKLKSVIIYESITAIDSYAFNGCSALTEIVIPYNVTDISYGAFEGCSGLTIYCEAESQPSGWVDGWKPYNCSVVWGYEGE